MKNTPETLAGLPIALFETPKDWEQWLSENYTNQSGLWLKIAKKISGKWQMITPDLHEAAACTDLDGKGVPTEIYSADCVEADGFTTRPPRQ